MSSDSAAYREARERGGIVDLSGRAIIRLTGADRVRYLNGQVTQNVQRLTPALALPACITSPKGRLDAVVVLSMEPDALVVDAEPEQLEPLLARLGKYIIADDVEVADASEDLRLLHCLGFDPAPLLGAALFEAGFCRAAAGNRFGADGWDVWCRSAHFAQVRAALVQSRPCLEAEMLEVLRVERGVPGWGRELDAATLPPEAGLDRTHIDYHKGCYIGQEVISRLRSVGHVNRQLMGFVSVADTPLSPGMTVHREGEAGGSVGQLTSAVRSIGLEAWAALGYLKRGAPTSGLVARSTDATLVEVIARDLPLYA